MKKFYRQVSLGFIEFESFNKVAFSLQHLVDIRTEHFNGDVVKFVIDFTFEKNDYFQNRVLSKTYILNCVPDSEDPLAYDGAEIVKCEGCHIDWKPAMNPEKNGKP